MQRMWDVAGGQTQVQILTLVLRVLASGHLSLLITSLSWMMG